MGVAEVEISLSPGSEFLINDPDFLDLVSGLQSLSVLPSNSTVSVGEGRSLTAQATFADGTTPNLSSSVTWNSSSPSIATVDETGFVRGTAVGNTTITATLGAVSGSTGLTVLPAAEPVGPDVVILSDTTFDTDTGVLGGVQAPGWDAVNNRLAVNSFVLDPGATLTVTGTAAFEVLAQGDLTVSGTIDYNGAAGTSGAAGSPGGEVTLNGQNLTFRGPSIATVEQAALVTPACPVRPVSPAETERQGGPGVREALSPCSVQTL